MTLSREFINLLFRTDLETIVEQNLWTAVEQRDENHLNPMTPTLGDVFKGRDRVGFLEGRRWERRHRYVQGGGLGRGGLQPTTKAHPPEPHKFPCEDPYCDRCNEAIKRLFRDVGLLPSGKPDRLDLTDEPFSGRFREPAGYRKDESDK